MFVVPDVVPELCTDEVLVSEWLDAMSFDEACSLPQAQRNRIGEAVYRFYCGEMYRIGRFVGVEMFKPDARFLKQRYLDEAHAFFEKNGPLTIFLARFVPIVRTLAPIVAGSAKMSFSKFTLYNVLGAVVWGAGITLLGYWLGQIEAVQKLIEPIFILIVVLSVLPMFIEWYRRRRAGKAALDDAA